MMNAQDEMDCKKAADKLYDLLDGELTADVERKLREHVSGCPHCFTSADFEKRFLTALEQLKARGCCPDALRAKVTESLRSAGFRG